MDYKNDFYSAINQQWINNKQLADNQTHLDNFSELNASIDDYFSREINKWFKSGNYPKNYGLEDFLTFYQQASDFEKRERLGVNPILPILNRYQSMNSFKDYISQLSELELLGQPNLLPFHLAPDLLNATEYTIWAEAPGLTFPDISFYSSHNKQGESLLDTWLQCQKKLLQEFGLSESEATDILNKVIILDTKLSKYLVTNQSNFEGRYNIYSFDDFCRLVPELPLKKFFKNIINDTPTVIIVPEESFWTDFASKFYSQELWEYLKAKLIYGIITMYSSCLTNKIKLLADKFRCKLLGIDNTEESLKQAPYDLTQFILGKDLNYWYFKQSLSSKDVKNVKELTNTIISKYKSKIIANDSLTLETKREILNKLDNLVVQIGGPDQPIFRKRKLSLEECLVDSINHILESTALLEWSKWGKKVSRKDWEITSFTVDAYYNAQLNKITLPAGILQKPFYSNEYSFIKNLSRIGFLIAHEISHAFDIDGTLFDEYGSYRDWLDEKDKKYFQIKIKQVKHKYNNLTFKGFNINGISTLSENIADIAGFSCVEDFIVTEFPEKLREFYCEFTKLWRIIEREEYLKMIILTDSHLPNKLRVNQLLSNSQKFIETYQILERNNMWNDPKNQIIIW